VGDAYIKQSVFPGCMANGLTATEAHVLAATQLPLATIALTQQTGVPAWKTIPSWAVVGTADHAIPLPLQGWLGHVPRRARRCQSIAEISCREAATASLAARQARRRHRIKAIRAICEP
jgi:hypothetical protein